MLFAIDLQHLHSGMVEVRWLEVLEDLLESGKVSRYGLQSAIDVFRPDWHDSAAVPSPGNFGGGYVGHAGVGRGRTDHVGHPLTSSQAEPRSGFGFDELLGRWAA